MADDDDANDDKRRRAEAVEPLYAALEPPRRGASRSGLVWKLVWAALVLLALLAVALSPE